MMKLTAEEKHLILELRQLRHGEVTIKKQDFKIVSGTTTERWDKQAVESSLRLLEKPKKRVDIASG